MPVLEVIVTSTRENRLGHAVGEWFMEQARKHGKFDTRLVDLREVKLPLFDEPNHPVLRKYEHEHTKRWAELVAQADCYVFVTPEYNHAIPPAMLNALDYLVHEWAYKAAGFVSYGGVSGGTRAMQMAKQVLSSLKMVPLVEAVSIPFVKQHLKPDGTFDPGPLQEKPAAVMLDELVRWDGALRTLRER